MAEKKRINWLLILQGWAMLWVVIGHSYLSKVGEGPWWENALFDFAYSFHMPLFMLVSGWLFYITRLTSRGRVWTWWQILIDKAIRLLVPGLFFSIVAFALKILFPGEMSRQIGLNLNDVIHAYLYPYDNPMRELWFIVTLYGFFVLTPLWRFSLKSGKMMWVVTIILGVVHFVHPNVELLCLGKIVSYAIWFFLGIVISKTDMVERVFNKNAWLTLLIGIVIYIVGLMTDGFVTTMGGIVLSFGLALLLDNYWPKTFFTFRNYTYQIFLIGIFAQMFVKIVYKHINVPYILAYIVCIIVGLYVPVIVAKLIEKINWKPLSLCVGLRVR